MVVGPASGTTFIWCCVSHRSQEQPQQPTPTPSEMGQDSLSGSVKGQQVCSTYKLCCHAGGNPQIGHTFQKDINGGMKTDVLEVAPSLYTSSVKGVRMR